MALYTAKYIHLVRATSASDLKPRLIDKEELVRVFGCLGWLN